MNTGSFANRQLEISLVVQRHGINLTERILAVKHPAVGAREQRVGDIADARFDRRVGFGSRTGSLNPLPLEIVGDFRTLKTPLAGRHAPGSACGRCSHPRPETESSPVHGNGVPGARFGPRISCFWSRLKCARASRAANASGVYTSAYAASKSSRTANPGRKAVERAAPRRLFNHRTHFVLSCAKSARGKTARASRPDFGSRRSHNRGAVLLKRRSSL